MSDTPSVALFWEEYDALTHDDVRGEYIDGELWVDYPSPNPDLADVHRVAMALRRALAAVAVVKTGMGRRLGDGVFGRTSPRTGGTTSSRCSQSTCCRPTPAARMSGPAHTQPPPCLATGSSTRTARR